MEKTYTIELTAEEIKLMRLSLSTAAIHWEDRGLDERADTVWELRDRFTDLLK